MKASLALPADRGKVEGVRVGKQIESDAIGTWHRLEGDGPKATLRVLREDLVETPGAREMMLEEIRRMRGMNHPHLLRVLKVEPSGARPWYATESIESPSLRERLDEKGALSLNDAIGLYRNLLQAATYLEGRRQFHIAMRPARILDVNGTWKLRTFRDVRAWDEARNLKGRKVKDWRYAPPERRRDHPAPAKPLPWIAWSLGCALRACLGAGSPHDTDGNRVPVPRSLPSSMRTMIEALTHEDPLQRPQGGRALERILEGGPLN